MSKIEKRNMEHRICTFQMIKSLELQVERKNTQIFAKKAQI